MTEQISEVKSQKRIIKAVSYPNVGVVCEQNIDELRRIFNRKFPTKLKALEEFIDLAFPSIQIVPIPDEETDSESKIRDIMDRPILKAAINANVDVILTGDKDFLESGITTPLIMTASDFLKL